MIGAWHPPLVRAYLPVNLHCEQRCDDQGRVRCVAMAKQPEKLEQGFSWSLLDESGDPFLIGDAETLEEAKAQADTELGCFLLDIGPWVEGKNNANARVRRDQTSGFARSIVSQQGGEWHWAVRSSPLEGGRQVAHGAAPSKREAQRLADTALLTLEAGADVDPAALAALEASVQRLKAALGEE